jgi:transcriptional regulator with PAS, ATPase and Fis domain
MKISAGAARALLMYDWPGNVRELKNEMERIIALFPGETTLGADMLSASIMKRSRSAMDAPCGEGLKLTDAVVGLEKRMIGEALEKCSGNRTRTARVLGITRQGLLKKMKRYSISCSPGG